MKIENLKPVDPNEVCLKDVNPIIEELKKRKHEARKENAMDMYIAFSEAINMLEDAQRIGAAEFVRQETGKTIRELSEELPLYEILKLIDKLYYVYQIRKEREAQNDQNA